MYIKILMDNQLLLKTKKFMVLLIKKFEDFAGGIDTKMWTIITIEHGCERPDEFK